VALQERLDQRHLLRADLRGLDGERPPVDAVADGPRQDDGVVVVLPIAQTERLDAHPGRVRLPGRSEVGR
jgi:hypothetical protein